MNNFFELKGKTVYFISGDQQDSEFVTLKTTDGWAISLWHSTDCCEHVRVVGCIGNKLDIYGSEILSAEEDSPMEHPLFDSANCESYTITVFKLTTAKGVFEIVWVGESNGFYGEGVDVSFEKI